MQQAISWRSPLPRYAAGERMFAQPGASVRCCASIRGVDIDISAGVPICTAKGRRQMVGHRNAPDETCRQCSGRLPVVASIEDQRWQLSFLE